MTHQPLASAEAGPGSHDTDAADVADSATSETTSTVIAAFAANLVIALAKLAGGLLAGSAAMLSEAAHSLADTSNQIFLLVSLRRSVRPADSTHPFGYGKERYVWSMLAAVGIFVTGACFSMYEGIRALTGDPGETSYYPVLYAVLAVSACAEASSLAKAVRQLRRLSKERELPARRVARDSPDTALATVLAEDSTAVVGVILAAAGLVLHQLTGHAQWEGAASIAIAVLLGFVALQLGRKNMDLLIGQSANPALRLAAWDYLAAAKGVDRVLEVQTMQLAPDSVLLAARIDLEPGLESEWVEQVAGRLRTDLAARIPEAAGHIYLDITDATAENSVVARRAYAALQADAEL